MKTKHLLLTIFAMVAFSFSVSAHEGCNKKATADSALVKKECVKTTKTCCKEKPCCKACTCKGKCTCKDAKTCCCNKDGKTCTCKEGACCKGTTKAKAAKQTK